MWVYRVWKLRVIPSVTLTSDQILCFIVEIYKNVSADQTNRNLASESQKHAEAINKGLSCSDVKSVFLAEKASKSNDLLNVSSDNLHKESVISSSDISGNTENSDAEISDTEDFTRVSVADRPRFVRHMDEYGRCHNEELHQCDTCKGMFLKSSYFDHVNYCAKRTPKAQLPVCGDDKVFLCKLCGVRGIGYAKHCEEHLANKPYKCSECSFSAHTKRRVGRHCRRPACAPNSSCHHQRQGM